jgi:dTDP-3-amino-3,4,6-trideoxy-alpha-D-glucose transaminase
MVVVPPPIPFVALDREHAALRGRLADALDRVVRESDFVLGDEVDRFETEFAALCGVRACVGVASGTAALTIVLEAAGIGRGDQVIVPAHAPAGSVLGVLRAGATPLFCDVERGTGLIDARSAAAVVTPRTAAVLAVHLYGQACEMDDLTALARRHDLLVVEDAGHAPGAGYRGRATGSLGHAAAFGFDPTGNLGALGDAGAICTDDLDLADRLRRLRNRGQTRSGTQLDVGHDERLDELQAAFLRVKLRRLSAGNRARREVAAAYREALVGVRTLVERDHTPSVAHVFPIRVADRDAARAQLQARGVQTAVHYPCPAHRHPAWSATLAEPTVALEEACAWAAEEISLPMHPDLRDDELQRVVAACRDLEPAA